MFILSKLKVQLQLFPVFPCPGLFQAIYRLHDFYPICIISCLFGCSRVSFHRWRFECIRYYICITWSYFQFFTENAVSISLGFFTALLDLEIFGNFRISWKFAFTGTWCSTARWQQFSFLRECFISCRIWFLRLLTYYLRKHIKTFFLATNLTISW